jgi:hypothetical protein
MFVVNHLPSKSMFDVGTADHFYKLNVSVGFDILYNDSVLGCGSFKMDHSMFC